MHRPGPRLAAVLALLLLASVSTAQAPPLDLSIPPEAQWSPSAPRVQDGALSNPLELSSERWHMDLLLGLPTGLRTQFYLGDNGRSAFVGEAFAGVYVFLPMVGAGLRYRFTPVCEGGDTFRISPGVDVYGLFWSASGSGYFSTEGGSATLISADVDFAWEHNWERLGCELGLKVGIGELYGKYATDTVPMLAVYGGFKF